MKTRRQFISIVPLAGASLLAACGDKPAPAPSAPAPSAAPTAAPAAPAAPATAAAPAAPTPAAAPGAPGAPAMVNPADPDAAALAYTPRASESKHEKYAPPAACGNCVMYAGKPGEDSGPCPLFIGKHVAAPGWCAGYNKRG